MRDLVIFFIHIIATLARLLGPGGIRSVVAESVLIKQQLLILNRSRHRSPSLRSSDRLVAGLCALFIRPARLIRSAIILKPSTLLSLHQALRNRKYQLLFSPGPVQRDRRENLLKPTGSWSSWTNTRAGLLDLACRPEWSTVSHSAVCSITPFKATGRQPSTLVPTTIRSIDLSNGKPIYESWT